MWPASDAKPLADENMEFRDLDEISSDSGLEEVLRGQPAS